MIEAPFSLTLPKAPLAVAKTHAERLEYDVMFDPLAVAISETDEANGLWEVIAYFDSHEAAQEAAEWLGIESAVIASVDGRDWVRESLEGLAPVAAGRFFLHGSHDRHRRRSGGISLEVDAGTAFGTGHHGTTEGCLMALNLLLKRGRPRRILDVGCGTGILALAAVKAAGSIAIACDIDPEAVRVTKANARRNTVQPLVHAVVSAGLRNRRIVGRAPFDLIFANILARPLVALARDLARSLGPHGNLILSGITADQAQWIRSVYRARGLVLVARIDIGTWVTLVLARPLNGKRPAGRSAGRRICRSKPPRPRN